MERRVQAKVSWLRALADELGCELFEVASEDADGDPVNGERRLRAFRAAQKFLRTTPGTHRLRRGRGCASMMVIVSLA